MRTGEGAGHRLHDPARHMISTFRPPEGVQVALESHDPYHLHVERVSRSGGTRGDGARAIADLQASAARHGVAITLDVLKPDGRPISALVRMYRRLGFASRGQDRERLHMAWRPERPAFAGSETEEKDYVRRSEDHVRDVASPSEEVQLSAVDRHPGSIRHIADPAESAQLLAVARDPWTLRWIGDPTEAVTKAAIAADRRVSRYVRPCAAARRRDGG